MTHRAIDAVWRIESARLIAGLARMVRDVGLAEDLAQDALVAALEQWPESGVPDNPGAWLMAIAKRRAIDLWRRQERLERKIDELGHELETGGEGAVPEVGAALDDDMGDDLLRLVFISPETPASAPCSLRAPPRVHGDRHRRSRGDEASALGEQGFPSHERPDQSERMRMLVFGGTVFLSKTIATEALRRGHAVLCVARGRSGTVAEDATHVVVDRDDPGALDGLRGERLDAVVDVATMSLRWVRGALAALASTTAHWTFVSTLNVYADLVTPGQRADAPLLEPHLADAELNVRDPELYGAVKVASEDAVRAAFPAGAFVVRPGLITGPGDPSDRFGYWPARLARGGRAVVPGVPEQPAQYVDVRDLAAWIVDAAEQRITGDYDGIGPAVPLPEVLSGIADAVGAPDLELVEQPAAALEAAGITPWSGPRSLPLWMPPTHWGVISHDAGPAAAAGLRHRDLADAAAGALAHERKLGLDRERKAGLTPAEEAELLS